jgi:hypothetical protein
MTETTGTTPTPDEATPQRSRPRRMILAAAGLAVVALIVGIAAFAITRDDDDPQPSATEQIAVARQACQQWLDSDRAPDGPGPGAGWCDDMAGRMPTHMSDGQMMMGRGMWASPEAMRDVCTRAMGDTPTATGDPTDWCDQMVNWMTQHEGDWDHWHHNWDD